MRTTRTAAAVFLVLLLGAPASGVGAQPDTLALDVRLVRPWFGPETSLALEVEVHNLRSTTLTDLRVTVALYQRVRSRSELDLVLAGRIPRTPLQAFTYRVAPVPADATQTLRVDEPHDRLDAFEGAPDGLYPVVVTVRTSTEPALEEAVTALSLMNEPAEVPLRVLPVLEAVLPPLVEPDGTPASGTAGRLRNLRGSLEAVAVRPVPAGLAVAPLLLDELEALDGTDLSADAEAIRALLRDIAQEAQPLVVPQPHAHLPHLATEGRLAEALDAGTERLRAHLGQPPGPMAYPPGLRLDTSSLAVLDDRGHTTTLAPGELLTTDVLTPADPTRVDEVIVVPVDEALGATVAAATTDLEVGHAVAGTAMVYFESPGRRRTIAVRLDLGNPLSAAYLDSLHATPWTVTVAPSEAADPDAGRQSVRWPDSSPPPAAFQRSLALAEAAVADLAAFTLDDNPVLRRLEIALTAARGTATWERDWSGGRTWAGRIVAAVHEQQGLLEVQSSPVTFTSHRGEVPVTIVNRAGFPVRVRVEVDSAKLRFPEGNSRVLDPVRPPGETVTFPALADATGTFPMTITLTSADGRALIASEEVLVRSTAANLVAVALTIGAALFLVVWYARRLLRGRTAS